MWSISFPWWHLLIRSVVVYVAVLMLLRLGGKRQVGQLNVAQFAALLLISNAVQNSMNGGDNSITGGLISAAVLILLSYVFSFLTYHSKDWENFIQGSPTLLIHHGRLIHSNLRAELMSIRELRVLLRKQGVQDLADVEEAVLESDGFISITRKSDAAGPDSPRNTDDDCHETYAP
jgi:uncharacterized membrane protein YcaP (DUF421 family)